jgi:hypothetical protein
MKIIKIIGLVILLIVLLAIVYLGYGLSKIRSGAAKDLGVKYSMQDYLEGTVSKAGVEVDSPEQIYLGSNFKTEGTHVINQTFSDAQISAIQNYSNEKNGPFKDVQIHFVGNNQIEASGFVNDPRVKAPVYVKGEVKQTGPKSFSISTDNITVGGFSLPSPIRGQVDSAFTKYTNDILAGINGLDIKSVTIENGQVNFVGNVPNKVSPN